MSRRESGKELLIVGSEKENDLLKMARLILGISSKLVLDDLRIL